MQRVVVSVLEWLPSIWIVAGILEVPPRLQQVILLYTALTI
jgi:hypothetical protein